LQVNLLNMQVSAQVHQKRAVYAGLDITTARQVHPNTEASKIDVCLYIHQMLFAVIHIRDIAMEIQNTVLTLASALAV